MKRERVQCRRDANDSRGSADDVGGQEKETNNLLGNGPANKKRHVRDGMAAGVSITEVALYDGAVRVEEGQTDDDHSAREGAEGAHGRRDR